MKTSESTASNRARSRSRSKSLEDTSFPFIMLIPSEFYELFVKNENEKLFQISKMTNVSRIHLVPNLNICYIYDSSSESKRIAMFEILKEINLNSIKDQQKNGGELQKVQSSLLIMIPEDTVSLLIGSKGKTIKQIEQSTNTNVSVKRSVQGFKDRQVEINGSLEDISHAACQIYDTVEGFQVVDKHSNIRYEQTIARFLFPTKCVNYVIGKQGHFTKEIAQKYRVQIKFFRDDGPPCRKEESVTVLQGDLQDVQDVVFLLLNKVKDYVEMNQLMDDGILMLIPNVYISKFIANGGKMMKDVSQLCKANIKIIPDESKSHESRNAVVQIMAYNTESKCKTANMILQKLEEFQKGIDLRPTERNAKIQLRSQSPVRNDSRHDHRTENKNENRHENRHENRQQVRMNSGVFDKEDMNEEKAHVNIIVPSKMVALLIGKNGVMIKDIMQKSNSQINFLKESSRDHVTPDGNSGRVCQIKGTSREISYAIEIILDSIMYFESSTRKADNKKYCM